MTEPTITCPKCRTEIRLTESLAAPLIESTRRDHEKLLAQKKAIIKQWAKREEQVERVIQTTVGMYGDLQGIAGRSLQEIEGLSLKALEGATVNDIPLSEQ